jgi:hypothetical protein
MSLSISYRLVLDRAIMLGIGEQEIRQETGLSFDQIKDDTGLDSPIRLGQLCGLARLLQALPLDLLVHDPGEERGVPLGDALLLVFALAAEPRQLPDLAAFLGWSPHRLNATINSVGWWHGSRVLDAAGGWWRVEVCSDDAQDLAEGDQWLPRRIAPDPFDAIAVLHIAHAHLLNSTSAVTTVASAADLRRLIERHLAVPDEDSMPPGLFDVSGYDTPARLHSDLLFALDLAGPPTDQADSSPGPAKSTNHARG